MDRRGITMIEILIYIAILALLLPVIVATMFFVNERQGIYAARAQIEQSAGLLEAQLRHEIVEAKQINSSASYFANDLGSLIFIDADDNTVTIDTSGSPARLRFTRGSDPSFWFTDNNIRVTKWRIERIINTSDELTGLKFEFALEPKNSKRVFDSAKFEGDLTISLSPHTIEL
ncbi:MAG: prepilin-type N-terminal cleavage/methylation domain-containing protein [Patescibacteria group bacterium]